MQHRDRLSDTILGVAPNAVNTRPWVYVIKADDAPVKIVHQIEASILDHLPGSRLLYSTRAEYLCAIDNLALASKSVAAQFSSVFPVISFLDHGAAQVFASAGMRLESSADLVQELMGVLDSAGIRSHEEAARHLYATIAEVWQLIARTASRPKPLTEGEVHEWVSERLRARGLTTDSGPVVAVGTHSADPHHRSVGSDWPLQRGDVVQLDIWGRMDSPDSVYADIAWVGTLSAPSSETKRVFEIVARARDEVFEFLSKAIETRQTVSGADADRVARAILHQSGFGAHIKHRTGHSIGAEAHGYGVNLDSEEAVDDRSIVEGSCFSIEPGLYLPSFGMRSEINVYVHDGRAVISGGVPQQDLLSLTTQP